MTCSFFGWFTNSLNISIYIFASSIYYTNILQYQYNGHTVTGKLFKKSPNSTDANPIWIVTPSDKRRRNEDVSESLMGKVVTEAEAMANRGPKLKPENKVTPESSSSPKSNSEEEIEEEEPKSPKRRSGRTTPSSTSSGKRKSDESKNSGSGGGKASKKQKGVAFTQESDTSKAKSTKDTKTVGKKKKLSSRKIGTRSKGGTTEMLLLPEIVTKKKTPSKTKKIKKGDIVTVVKMLTGTLYMYRGDHPRAEFIRSK